MACPLKERIDEITSQSHYRHAHWGYKFVDAECGDVLASYQEEKCFAPASVAKLFTAAGIIRTYGETFRWRTPVVRRGEVDEQGVLRGDLILIAGGDPTLGGRHLPNDRIAFTDVDHTYANSCDCAAVTPQNPLSGIELLARQIAHRGIRRIAGEVLVDDRLFDLAQGCGAGPGRITPVVVNDNCIDIIITPTRACEPASVEWRPHSSMYSVEACVNTVDSSGPAEVTVSAEHPGRIDVTGTIPMGRPPLIRVHEVENATAFARALLIEALLKAGVAVDAPIAVQRGHLTLPSVDETDRLPVVARIVSAPLSEAVKLVLKTSHNLHAGLFVALIAVKHGKRTVSEGLSIERDLLRQLSVPVDSLSLSSGSGGSGGDFVSPEATVALLRSVWKRREFGALRSGLPVLGVDGTLRREVDPSSRAVGQVLAKTGTWVRDNLLSRLGFVTSKSLAGYVKTKTGRQVAFAIFVNGVHLSEQLDSFAVGKDLVRICETVFQDT